MASKSAFKFNQLVVTDVSFYIDIMDDWCGLEMTAQTAMGEELEDKIRILVENESSCCEYWGVCVKKAHKFNPKNYEMDFNTKMCSTFKDDVLKYGISDIRENTEIADSIPIREGSVYVYNIQSGPELYYVIAFNCHNGYYPHELWTSWPISFIEMHNKKEVMGISYYRRVFSKKTTI